MRNEREGATRLPSIRSRKNKGKLTSGLALTVIGLSSLTIAAKDLYSVETGVSREINSTYPQKVSMLEVGEAQREILLFDSEVHNLILRNESWNKSTHFDPQTLDSVRDKIALIRQEKDKQELRRRLYSGWKSNLREFTQITGGVVGLFAGMFGISLMTNALKSKDKEQK